MIMCKNLHFYSFTKRPIFGSISLKIITGVMALVDAIEYRTLAVQLSVSETRSFITKLSLSDPQVIIRSLSFLFIHQSTNEQDNQDNAKCNKMISTIIRSRDRDEIEPYDNKLDTLPRHIIGICASFLGQVSYTALSATNGLVYLGCSAPNQLDELTVCYNSASYCKSLDLSAFSFVRKLRLSVARIISTDERINRVASQIARMPRLQSLNLSGVDSKAIGMIANHETTNGRTKYLTVLEWTSAPGMHTNDQVTKEWERFISAISAFKHIQFLKFSVEDPYHLRTFDRISINPLVESYANLIGLDFDDRGTGVEFAILQSIGDRLQYLVLYDQGKHLARFLNSKSENCIDFANLRQLQHGHRYGQRAILGVMKTAVNLEKVKLLDPEWAGRQAMDPKEVLERCVRLRGLPP